MFNGKIHYKWSCSIAFCMFTPSPLVIPCHRTRPSSGIQGLPKGSKGLEHLGQEIRRNLQQIVPMAFHHRHEVLSRELAGRILGKVQWP